MASQEKREFDKYLKFLTFKATQVVVQSRQGRRLKTRSNARGNEWILLTRHNQENAQSSPDPFPRERMGSGHETIRYMLKGVCSTLEEMQFNLSILDDKQVSSELKRSLEGRIPSPDQPVCIEIQMETPGGNTLVLEVWSVSLDLSKRDISVSVTHLLYPRLSLMLKSLVSLSRTTPAYRLSRRQEDELHFTFRVYAGAPDIAGHTQEFKRVKFAETSSPYGTIGLSVYYKPSITLPDRSVESMVQVPTYVREDSSGSISLSSGGRLQLPFAPQGLQTHRSLNAPAFGAILPQGEPLTREDSVDGLNTLNEEGSPRSDQELASMAVAREQDGYIMVDMADIKPAFANHSATDELSAFLQQCKETPSLDLFSSENSMDVTAAMELIDGWSQESKKNSQSTITIT